MAKTDFLIIGGGIAGISAAARLSHFGKVILLEAEKALGYHASGRSAAMFEERYGLPEVVTLNRASRHYLTHENGGVLSPRGLLLVAHAQEKDQFEADLTTMNLDRISPEDAQGMVPILDRSMVHYAAHHGDAFDLDTDLLMQNFAREARRNGAEIVTGQEVSKISKSNAGWLVDTDKTTTYSGTVLINAAGAWADVIAELAGLKPVGLTPLRRSMALVPAPGDLDLRNWPMLFGPDESWYAKPDAGKLLISPAEEDATTPHDAWAGELTLAEGIARFEAYVTTEVTRLESSWAGLRTFAPDRRLVIGFDPVASDFFWLAGQGGYGFQTAPAASQLAADLIQGRMPEIGADLALALSPARF